MASFWSASRITTGGVEELFADDITGDKDDLLLLLVGVKLVVVIEDAETAVGDNNAADLGLIRGLCCVDSTDFTLVVKACDIIGEVFTEACDLSLFGDDTIFVVEGLIVDELLWFDSVLVEGGSTGCFLGDICTWGSSSGIENVSTDAGVLEVS